MKLLRLFIILIFSMSAATIMASGNSESLSFSDGEYKKSTLSNLNIGPIPTHDVLEISVNATSFQQVTVSVYNIIGDVLIKDVYQLNSGTNSISLRVRDLVKGFYFVSISSDNTQLALKRFMKE